METAYYKEFSNALNRDMEWKVYGHAGQPIIYIPCQDGRFYDFENFHMTDVWAPWIDAGEAMIIAIDTLDLETWSNKEGDPRWRIERHEAWVKYITDEMVPFAEKLAEERNEKKEEAPRGRRRKKKAKLKAVEEKKGPQVLLFGASLGGTHAANLYLRRPDLFKGALALSGIYTAEYGFGDYMDELVYLNSPVHYMENLPEDHPYIPMYNEGRGIICVGQGDWEQPETTFKLRDIFWKKGIDIWVDIWGYDCCHDWNWWYKQVTYFAPFLLGQR